MKTKDTGWKQEMDKLYERTRKNWKSASKVKKSRGLNATLNLGSKAHK